MIYQTWFLVYWDEKISDSNSYCHVFSERMAKDIVIKNPKVSIDTISGMKKEDILKHVYDDIDIIDDLAFHHPIFAKEKFKIFNLESRVIDYYPIGKYRSDRLGFIGI
jgi:hypothetical protein